MRFCQNDYDYRYCSVLTTISKARGVKVTFPEKSKLDSCIMYRCLNGVNVYENMGKGKHLGSKIMGNKKK